MPAHYYLLGFGYRIINGVGGYGIDCSCGVHVFRASKGAAEREFMAHVNPEDGWWGGGAALPPVPEEASDAR